MSTLGRVFTSSVGTKLLIGLTGLALFAYMVLHLVGNALIFAGPETFNEYSHVLISNPLLLPVESGSVASAARLQGVYNTCELRARPGPICENEGGPHTPAQENRASTRLGPG